MTKILYTSFLNEDIRPGYKLKIHSQCQAFHNIGLETYLFIVNNEGLILYKMTDSSPIVVREIKNTRKRLSAKRNPIDEYLLFNLYINQLQKISKEISPDLLYMRRIVPLTDKLIKALRVIKKQNIKLMYEYPTFPWEKEMLVNKQYAFYMIDKFFYKKLEDVVDKFIIVGTKDVSNPKMIEISNAISANNLALKKEKINDLDEINLLAVAHVSFFHGYDRLIEGFKNYYSNYKEDDPKIILNIVGPVDKKLKLENQVESYKLGKYVHFLGYKSGSELDRIFDAADIGVGCLGVHRKNIHFLNSLKNREYAGRGIPFIYSECDYLIEKEKPNFIGKFPENDEPIDLYEVIKFHKSEKMNNLEIRNFALKHLSWEAQQKIIMENL